MTAEHDRRMKLPLRKDADGLLRIHVEDVTDGCTD